MQLKHYCIENNKLLELYFKYVLLGDLFKCIDGATVFYKKQISFQVFFVVKFFHNRFKTIVYRDIKLENVLVQK